MTTSDSSTSDSVVASIPQIDAGSYRYDPSYRRAAIDPPSMAAYAALSQRVERLRAAGDGVRSIQLTSSNPEEGTSTVASHLAVALADDGTDVVLIDANLRRPRLRELFDLDGRAGLADVILGRARLGDVMHEIEDAEGLVVVPAGIVSQNPAYLMVNSASEERLVTLSQVITSLADLGYFVVIDSPPVLMVTDALAMAHSVDAVLVVSNAASRSSDLARARTLLDQVDAPVFGRVVVHSIQSPGTTEGGPTRSPGSRLRAALGRGRPRSSPPQKPPAAASRKNVDASADRSSPSRVRLASSPVEPAPPATTTRPVTNTRPAATTSRRPAAAVEAPPTPSVSVAHSAVVDPSVPVAPNVVVPPMPPSPRLGRQPNEPVEVAPEEAVPAIDVSQPSVLSRTTNEMQGGREPTPPAKQPFPPIPGGRLVEHHSPVPATEPPKRPAADTQTARPPIPPPPRPPIPPPPPPPEAEPEPRAQRGRVRRHRARAKTASTRTARR